tara:strand:+ start:1065 stop:1343 length:279 start_codon:yes stop_codon:yes gene_type:complete
MDEFFFNGANGVNVTATDVCTLAHQTNATATAPRPTRAAPARVHLIAVIENPAVGARILRHLKLPTETPGFRPARAPPMALDDDLFVAADPA